MILKLLGGLVGTSWADAYGPNLVGRIGSLASGLMLSVICGHACCVVVAVGYRQKVD